MVDVLLVRELVMAASAQVIDLGEVRRQRALRATCAATPMPVPTMPLPMAWVPVWFFMPVWLSGQMDAVAASQVRV
jgi:hypothetical protein